MKRKDCIKIKIFYLTLLTSLLSAVSYCEDLSLKISLGSYGFSTETKFKNRYLLELRIWYEPEILIFSFKPAIKFYNLTNIDLFGGFEYAKIDFDADNISGDGYWLMPSVFVEYSFLERFFLKLDFGFCWITISSEGKSVSGPELILTTGVGYKIQ